MTCTKREAVETYTKLRKEAKNVGPDINKQKTMTLKQSRTGRHNKHFEIKDDIEAVKKCKYCGAEHNSN